MIPAAAFALKSVPATWWVGIVLALVLLAGAGVQTVRLAGEQAEHAKTKAAWDQEKASRAQAAAVQSETNREKGITHAEAVTVAVDQFQAGRAAAVAESAGRVDAAVSLRRSAETRAAQYRAMSEAGEAERERLAGHATRLDAALADGRVVAEQLRAAVVDRDQRIGLLGAVIQADRKLSD